MSILLCLDQCPADVLAGGKYGPRLCDREEGHKGDHQHSGKGSHPATWWLRERPAPPAPMTKREVAEEVLRRYPHYRLEDGGSYTVSTLEGLVADVMMIVREDERRRDGGQG